jgi:methionyl-tRNA formyltransferase
MASSPRIVAFCADARAYALLSRWAEARSLHPVLLITSKGRPAAGGTDCRSIITLLPPSQDIIVTTDVRRLTPLVAAAQPDLILCFTWPYLLPGEILALPRCGAVKVHPTPLPRYRGPNPARLLFDGAPELGATVHHMTADIDAGPILSCRTGAAPADASPENVQAVWAELILQALEEGVECALAGEPGLTQDDALATYAAPFTWRERWIDWALPARTIQRLVTALNLGGPLALAMIDGRPYLVEAVQLLVEEWPERPRGSVIVREEASYVIQTGQGALVTMTAPLPAPIRPGRSTLRRSPVRSRHPISAD